jgi:proteasome lid subunit RPN8/RPN11
MIHIEEQPWRDMTAHAEAAYPDECCGVMLGSVDDAKIVREAVPLDNVAAGSHRARYELRPEDLLRADKEARARGLDVVGIYHSHPDCGAYFSETDLKNSCPWYSFVVLSIQKGRLDHANSWLPNAEQTEAIQEEMSHAEMMRKK